MLRISKLTDYGTLILAHMAGLPGRLHSAAELAEAEKYLQNAEDRLDQHQYREARHAALEAKYRAQKALQLSEASKDGDGG